MGRPLDVRELLAQLRVLTGTKLEILDNRDDPKFQEHSKRWSEIGRQIPAAIVLPVSEEQIQTTVRFASSYRIPFVTKSGGHSHWSTIDDDGFVLDLSNYSEIEVDAAGSRAIMRGSVLTKDLSVALADAGYFAALGNGDSIGAIPYFLGGGASTTSSVTGYGSDQILAARMVSAKGDVIDVTAEKEAELLYGIRGAGQFLGVITELTIKIHPFASLGDNEGRIWSGRFAFPLDRASGVGSAMEGIMNDDSYATSGFLMIMAPPPDRSPSVVVSGRCIGEPEKWSEAYKALKDLEPTMIDGGIVPIQNSNDAHHIIEKKGGQKRWGVVGLRRFDLHAWLKTIEVWKELVSECPDAINTSFNFQWDSRYAKPPEFESAMSLHDVRYWQNNLLWFSDGANCPVVDKYNDKSIEIMRGPHTNEYVDFQNGTREGPIGLRYRPEAKLKRLQALKMKWDPNGVFTRQLLE